MTPVDQSILSGDPLGRPGDCLRACVATILDLPLRSVPHFLEPDVGGWWARFTSYMDGRGLAVLALGEPLDGVLGIGNGRSPRGDHNHAVVTLGPEVAHDPHPTRRGLEGPIEDYLYFVVVDPSRPYGRPS